MINLFNPINSQRSNWIGEMILSDDYVRVPQIINFPRYFFTNEPKKKGFEPSVASFLEKFKVYIIGF